MHIVKIGLPVLFLLVASLSFAQDTKIELKAPSKAEITVVFKEAKNSSMQVSKKDFLASYNIFKENYFKELPDSTVKRYEKAITFLKKQKSITISLRETGNGIMETLLEIVMKSVGVDLLNQGKAKVIVNNNEVAYINSRSLIPSPEAAYWTYSSPEGQDFFFGAMFGSESFPIAEEIVFFEEPQPAAEPIDSNKVYVIVEMQPDPDGMSSADYVKLVSSKVVYPQKALTAQASGTAFVEFVVGTDGTLTDFRIVRGPGFGLDEEAVRVIKEGPAWKPGKQNGTAVKVRMIIPVKMVLP
jgi:TonB family protein